MTPEKLRASILQYAMEGKLVKQDPNDEPASELLKKIENDKVKLIKEGKIKKSKKSPVITDDEKPFDIPDSWEWVRLEEIAQLNTGTTPSIGKSRYEGNYIPFIKPGDISSQGINYHNFGLSKDGLNHGRLISKNSLLTVCIGGSTGKTYYTDRAVSCNQQINSSTPYRNVNLTFLFYEMLSNYFQKEINQHASGSATPIINKTKFGKLCLPLPPLEEQKRIVAKIEKLMPLVDEYAKAYNKLQKIDNEFDDKLKQSILQYAMEGKLVPQDPNDESVNVLLEKIQAEKAELIKEKKIKKSKPLPPITDDEKPFDIPDSWEWVRLGDIVDLNLGKTPQRSNIDYWKPSEVRWVSISDLNNGKLTSTKESISQKAFVEVFHKEIIKKGTLLMSFKLTIGKMAILDIDAVHNEAIASIVPYFDKGYIFRNYLFCLLPLISKNGDFNSAIKGKTLNKTSLSNLLVPICPLEEQKRIINKIKELYMISKIY